MLTSWDERCGIAEYSKGLVEALLASVAVEVVPASFKPAPRAVYAKMGQALNGSEVAHVQHSYAFFGGMRPRLAGFPDLLAAIRVPLVVTVHELDRRATGAYHLPGPVELAYKRWFNRHNLLSPRIGAWIVHAEPLAEALRALGVPADRVRLLPMPVPEQVPSGHGPLPDAEAARAALGLGGRRVLTILGFLARRKGYDVAIEALSRLGPEYALVCAGDEHAADATGTAAWIRDLAQRAGVGERVIITGFVPGAEIPTIMAASDLILAPFTEMSGSASLHLALGYRKPIIASDLPANRALDCVALFPTGNAAALADAIERLMADGSARVDLQARAAAYAHERGYAALAAATIKIYTELREA
jgi:glycosyltransferase involved in cell wall biosynthesis